MGKSKNVRNGSFQCKIVFNYNTSHMKSTYSLYWFEAHYIIISNL